MKRSSVESEPRRRDGDVAACLRSRRTASPASSMRSTGTPASVPATHSHRTGADHLALLVSGEKKGSPARRPRNFITPPAPSCAGVPLNRRPARDGFGKYPKLAPGRTVRTAQPEPHLVFIESYSVEGAQPLQSWSLHSPSSTFPSMYDSYGRHSPS